MGQLNLGLDRVVPLKKLCPRCMEQKDIGEFGFRDKDPVNPGIDSYCAQCKREYGRATHMKIKYGKDQEWYEGQVVKQGGKCAICLRVPKARKNGKHALAVDHHHESGKVRELLCASCNQMIGLAREDIGTLERAVEYLGRHPSSQGYGNALWVVMKKERYHRYAEAILRAYKEKNGMA